MNRLTKWFYTTKLGEYYFDFLLWLDRKLDRPTNFTGKNTAQVVRQYSLLSDGVNKIKRVINTSIENKNKANYHKVLSNTDDLTKFAEREEDSAQAIYAKVAKAAFAKTTDVENALDHAKMIEGRIDDYKELQAYNAKRDLQKRIREATKLGNADEVNKLKEEWMSRYGRRSQ